MCSASCQTVMKIFLATFNVVFFITGAITLAFGIWVKVDKQHLLDLTKDVSGTDLNNTDVPSLLDNAVIVMIVAGSIIFFLGFVGCCGALQSKSKAGKLFLKTYAIVVLIVLVIEVAGIAVAWLFLDKLEETLQRYLDNSLSEVYQGQFTLDLDGTVDYSSGGDPITLAWDIVQVQFTCCGRLNGSDYMNADMKWNSFRTFVSSNGSQTNMTVPPSCCQPTGGTHNLISTLKKQSSLQYKLSNPQCPFEPANSSIPGCYKEVRGVIKDNSVIFIATGGSTLFLELLCVTIACCISKRDNLVEETKDF